MAIMVLDSISLVLAQVNLVLECVDANWPAFSFECAMVYIPYSGLAVKYFHHFHQKMM